MHTYNNYSVWSILIHVSECIQGTPKRLLHNPKAASENISTA